MAILDIKKKAYRNDPLAYLVIADQHDDAGDETTARVLRRQGETMRTLAEALTPACEKSPYRTLRLAGDLPCGCRYVAWVSRALVKLSVWGPVRGKIAVERNGATVQIDDRRRLGSIHMRREIIAEPTRQAYLTERIRREFFQNLNPLFAQP